VGARDDGEGAARGFVRAGPLRVSTTGFLGVVDDGAGQPQARAFPRWLTLPKDQDLASGRRWHFFFAWVLTVSLAAYFMANFIGRRLGRDLLPSRAELRGIVRSIREHLRFRVPEGEEARHYNILQKLAYLSIMFGIIPLVIVTGLAMSPAIDAAFPWLPQVFGGRQTARSLHFFSTVVLVSFFAVHILMIMVSGPLNELRSIVTGWFAIGEPSRGVAKERPNDESR
jgi:thiosulfate reductase cytochrome b subunit